MSEVIAVTIEELSAIIVNIFKSIRDDLIFPVETRSAEEQVLTRARSQKSTILSQEDQICSQARIVSAQAREIERLNELLVEREKEIEHLEQ